MAVVKLMVVEAFELELELELELTGLLALMVPSTFTIAPSTPLPLVEQVSFT